MAGGVEVRVQGAQNLGALAKQLKDAGEKELRKELLRAIRTSTSPAKEAIRTSARELLPRKGGLNEVIASSKIVTQTRTAGKQVGVRVVGSAKRMDIGKVRHPVFGRKTAWVEEQVTPGFFTAPLEGLSPEVRKQLIAAIDGIAAKFKA